MPPGLGRSTWDAIFEAWRRGEVAYASETTRRRLRQQLRFTALAAASSRSARAWFAFLDRDDIRPFAAANPMLAFKPFRPYLSTSWSARQRMTAMRDTYQFVVAQRGVFERALLDSDGVVLAEVPYADGETFQIVLGFDNRFRKEGEFELSLQLPPSHDRMLSMSFAFGGAAGHALTCYVGCMQGRSGTKDTMKTLTKGFHGVRPPALLVFALQVMTQSVGVSRLLGAGSTIQVHRQKHLIHLDTVHALHFDYDRLWSDVGATPAEDGWYALPLSAPRRTHDEIRTNKRAQYVRRYAALDDVEAQILRALTNAGPRRVSPPDVTSRD